MHCANTTHICYCNTSFTTGAAVQWQALSHKRVVRLLDVFEMSAASFATVLELCTGGDLDVLLKTNRCLPEKVCV
jgi:UDP-N-acetylmuramyl tripeptide synthase